MVLLFQSESSIWADNGRFDSSKYVAIVLYFVYRFVLYFVYHFENDCILYMRTISGAGKLIVISVQTI